MIKVSGYVEYAKAMLKYLISLEAINSITNNKMNKAPAIIK